MGIQISNPMDYKVGIYIRLSKEDDSETESQSVTNQRSMLENFTKGNQLYIYNEYVDDGYSGTSFDRPAFNRMINDIENKKINMVLTKDMSRLGRDYIQTGYYMEKYFPENRVRYISLLDDVDTGIDSATNDITPFKAIMNDMYAKDISKKIKSVKYDKQKKGLFIGGKASYGYKLSPDEKNMIIIDEIASINIKNIFRWASEGISCRQIAMRFNNDNVLTPAQYANINLKIKGPYAGKWSSERIAFILKNEVYIGNMVQGRTKKVNYKSPKCLKIPEKDWIVVPNTHEPIIDKETFDKVQLLINSRRHTRARTYDYLLKGLIYCHECGYPLAVIHRVLSGDKETLYFICRTYQRFTKLNRCTCHNIREEYVTRAVIDKVKEICLRYLDKDNLKNVADKIYNAKNSAQKQKYEIKHIDSEIETVGLRIDKMYLDKLEGTMDNSDFERVYKILKEKREILRKRKVEIKNLISKNSSEEKIPLDELIKKFLKSTEYNKELIVSLVERIELSQDKKIFIYFRFKELDELNP